MLTNIDLALRTLRDDPARCWTSSEVGSVMKAPTSTARTALVTVVQRGEAIQHEDGTFQAADVRGEILHVLRRDLNEHWTPFGLATELPHLRQSSEDMARHLLHLASLGAVEVYANLPGAELPGFKRTWGSK